MRNYYTKIQIFWAIIHIILTRFAGYSRKPENKRKEMQKNGEEITEERKELSETGRKKRKR